MPLREKLNRFIGKWKISRKTWQLSTVLLVGLAVVSAGGFLWSYSVSAEQEVTNTTYYCQQEAMLDYRVYLVPNELFEDRILEAGRAYMTSLTEYIAVNFEYNFFGESEAKINGHYGITASLVAMTAEGEHLVWKKEYELLPVTEFSLVEANYSIIEQIYVPLSDYLAFSEQVREETGYNPPELNLVVSSIVRVETVTEDGAFSEMLSPTMVIPMKGSSFTVGGNLVEAREGGITETKIIKSMAVANARVIFSVLVTMSVIALVLFRLLTVPAETVAKPKKHEVNTILKKHKERIVITSNGVAAIPSGAITVHDFDELLKLADEVSKPILYPQPKTVENTNHFFLIYTPENVFAYGVRDNQEDAVLEV